MALPLRTLTTCLLLATALPVFAAPADGPVRVHRHRGHAPLTAGHPQGGISQDPADYSDGFGTNVANSEPATPITPYGGYVVNQYGYGNYVHGPLGYGGYPAGSGGAEFWRQRQTWKCEYAPETC